MNFSFHFYCIKFIICNFQSNRSCFPAIFWKFIKRDKFRKLTQNILQKYITKKKIIYIKHKNNKGLPAARNTGIKKAKGEFISFLDDDDEFLPAKTESQLKIFKHKLDTKQFPGTKFWNKEIKNYISKNDHSSNKKNLENGKKIREKVIKLHLGISSDKIKFIDHSSGHIFYSFFSSTKKKALAIKRFCRKEYTFSLTFRSE